MPTIDQRIEEWLDVYKSILPHSYEQSTWSMVSQANVLLRDIQEERKWVSVEDRVPEHPGDYLVVVVPVRGHGYVPPDYEPYIVTAHADLGAGWEEIPNATKVTHWMPLPEVPDVNIG